MGGMGFRRDPWTKRWLLGLHRWAHCRRANWCLGYDFLIRPGLPSVEPERWEKPPTGMWAVDQALLQAVAREVCATCCPDGCPPKGCTPKATPDHVGFATVQTAVEV